MTRSLQLGINLDVNAGAYCPGAWNDVAKGFSGWFSPSGVAGALDALGYPTVNGMQTQCYMIGCPAGDYTLTWRGTATPTPKWWKMGPVTKDATGMSSATVTCTAPNSQIVFTVSGLNPADPLTDMHFYQPGANASSPIAATAWTNWLKPFAVIRSIDWAHVNIIKTTVPPGSVPPSIEWASRVQPNGWDQTSVGVAYENFFAICKQVGATPWVNVPFMASKDFMIELAALLASYGFANAYVELSNEVWNSQFGQWQQAYNLASAAGSPFGGSVQNIYADYARQMSFIFRAALGNKVTIVLSGQCANSAVMQRQLAWVDGKYGDTKEVFDVLAIAPYFPLAQPTIGMQVADIVAGCQSHITNVLTPNISDHMKLAATYGMPLVAYECGQALQSWHNNSVPTSPAFGSGADLPYQFQTDPNMGALYTQLLNMMQAGGMSLANHCSFLRPWGMSGFFPLQQYVTDAPQPKWSALNAFAQQPYAAPTQAPAVQPILSQTITVAGQRLNVAITPAN